MRRDPSWRGTENQVIPASSNIDGLEAKIVPWPKSDDDDASTSESDLSPERFILCRSRERSKKEEGITQRFEKKIEESLTRMKARCEKQARDPMKGEREIGRMLGKNSRAAKLFDVKVTKRDKNAARIEWSKVEATRDWTTLSAGCYLLRTNVADWSDEELWKAYIQLTEAEAAFRIHKSDLSIRPIWHQKEERVLAHIFVCFLAYGENKGGWNRIFVAEKRGSLCVCSFLCILCLFVARTKGTRNRGFAGHEKSQKTQRICRTGIGTRGSANRSRTP